MVVIAAAAWFGFAAATAGPDQSGWHGHGWQRQTVSSVAQGEQLAGGGVTLSVIEREVRSKRVDVGPQGFSSGDFFLTESRLFNESRTKVVGKDAVRCEVGLRTFTCEATALLDGRGKIRVAGTFFSQGDNVLPVTGGTKNFKGFGGAVQVFNLRGGDSLLVFKLVN